MVEDYHNRSPSPPWFYCFLPFSMSWSKVFPSFNFLFFFFNPYLKNSFPMRQIFDPFVFCVLPSLSLSWLENAAAHIFCLETMDHMLCHLNLWPRGSFILQRPKCFSCPGYVTSCSIIIKRVFLQSYFWDLNLSSTLNIGFYGMDSIYSREP